LRFGTLQGLGLAGSGAFVARYRAMLAEQGTLETPGVLDMDSG
jgi:hypothetical protein